MRFALRSRRGPHIPIGHDAKKASGEKTTIRLQASYDDLWLLWFFQSLKKEIERRIEVIPRVQYEPQLMSDHRYILAPGSQVPPHYYRLKAVDDVKTLGMFGLYDDDEHPPTFSSFFRRIRNNQVRQLFETTSVRKSQSLSAHYFGCSSQWQWTAHDTPILRSLRTRQTRPDRIQRRGVSGLFSAASQAHRCVRFHLLPQRVIEEFMKSLKKKTCLVSLRRARLLKSYPSSRKSSPSRTPIKKNVETKRNILEPRMRPPEEQILGGSRPNTLTVMTLDNNETSV